MTFFFFIPWNLEKEVLPKQGDASSFSQHFPFDVTSEGIDVYKVLSARQSQHQLQGQESVSSAEKQCSQTFSTSEMLGLGQHHEWVL